LPKFDTSYKGGMKKEDFISAFQDSFISKDETKNWAFTYDVITSASSIPFVYENPKVLIPIGLINERLLEKNPPQEVIPSKIDVEGGPTKTINVGGEAEFKIKIVSLIAINEPIFDIDSYFEIKQFKKLSDGHTYECIVQLKKGVSDNIGRIEEHLIFGKNLEKTLTVNIIPLGGQVNIKEVGDAP
jgi:hypothetical protein